MLGHVQFLTTTTTTCNNFIDVNNNFVRKNNITIGNYMLWGLKLGGGDSSSMSLWQGQR
jgi:hypothetical protein